MRASLLAVVMVVAISGPGWASTRVYEGEEAAALRCANTLALTAVALSQAQMIPDAEKNVMLEITVRILERHVSGSWRQKKSAMEVMRDRRSVDATLNDYRKNATRCLRQFPIN